MVTHMKTTIDIADALLLEAKQLAAQRGETLRELVEEGLRTVIGRMREPTVPYEWQPLLTLKGGMTPEAQGKSMHELILESYDDRS